jgi:hypothetical protein
MEIKRGVLQAFDAGTYLATVAMTGSIGVWLDGLAVSRAIASTEMIAGRHVGVLFFDTSNPNDAVICAVWAS